MKINDKIFGTLVYNYVWSRSDLQIKQKELGYEEKQNENYPLIESYEEIIKHIELVGINVHYQGAFGGRRHIGIAFDCSWDEENALGIRLLD